jgi:hypothetical protein
VGVFRVVNDYVHHRGHRPCHFVGKDPASDSGQRPGDGQAICEHERGPLGIGCRDMVKVTFPNGILVSIVKRS